MTPSADERPPFVIRRAVPADLDAVERLEDAVFLSDNLSRRSLRHLIGARAAVFLVLEQEAEIVGDAIVAFRRGSALARLYSLAVHGACAGRGFGSRLLERCETEAVAHGADRLQLEVRTDNVAAIRLYTRAGFMIFGRYEGYYEDGAAALRLRKRLVAEDASKG